MFIANIYTSLDRRMVYTKKLRSRLYSIDKMTNSLFDPPFGEVRVLVTYALHS